MSQTSVFCIATSQPQATRIVEGLLQQGFTADDLSVVYPDGAGQDVGHVKATKAPEGAATGAATGGVAGGVFGLLAGIGALAIPGVGPLIAAGPIMAALSGAAAGAAAGGIAGGLIGLGIPEIEAKVYEQKLREGNFLISARARDDEWEDRAENVFKQERADDISRVKAAHVPDSDRPDPSNYAPVV